jgi:trimethylamine--corrinoid protein Co-methyltransferase
MVVAERAMCARDQYPQTQPLHNYEAMVQNTGKHVVLGMGTAANAHKIKDMAAACIGGPENFDRRPTVSAIVCPTSPLILTKSCCEVVIECAKLNIGMVIIPLPLSGGTSPATVAGTLAIHNAEVLGVIALAQLVAKGAACIYGSCSTTMDLKTGTASFGAPEHGIINTGLTKLAQHYQLPCWVGGGLSDSKIPDCQAAYEFSLSAIVGALAGANVIYGAGCLDQGLTFDFAKLVMDAEQIQRILYTIKDVDLSIEALALDVIHEVGPGGEFLSHEHTYDHMRNMSQSDLFDRRTRQEWMQSTEAEDLTNRAYERAKKIIENHEPMDLWPNSAQTMKEIISDFEAELKADRN